MKKYIITGVHHNTGEEKTFKKEVKFFSQSILERIILAVHERGYSIKSVKEEII